MNDKEFRAAWDAIQPIRGWFSNKKQAHFMWEKAQSGNVIEIGTFCGRSAIFMAMAMRAAGAETKVYCVDTFKATNEELKDEDTYDEFLKNVEAHGVGQWISVLRADSHLPATAAQVPKDVALLYIDGDHSYDGLTADITIWRQHVRKEGFILFHDYYGIGGQFPEVRRAITAARLRKHINNVYPLSPDAAYSQRSTCGCGGW